MKFYRRLLKFKRLKKISRIWNRIRSLKDKLWKKLRTNWASMTISTCLDWEILKSIRKSCLIILNRSLKMQNSFLPCSEQKPLSELNAKHKRMRLSSRCLWPWSSITSLCQKETISRTSWRESRDWPFKLSQLEGIWNSILMNLKQLMNKLSKKLLNLSWRSLKRIKRSKDSKWNMTRCSLVLVISVQELRN